MCVCEIFRRFSTTEAISSKTSHLKYSRMANTLACQDEVKSRSEVMRHPNACPMKNKDEHVKMPQRKVQQPQLNGLSPLEFNDPGLHSPMASPRIFVLQRKVVEQLPFCTEERNICRQSHLRLDQRYYIPIFALDRQCKHQYRTSVRYWKQSLVIRIFEQ